MAKEEDADALRVAYQLGLVDSISRHAADVGLHDMVADGSDLDADDQHLPGQPTSHLVGHCLAISLDALETARVILRDPDTGSLRVPLVGQYPVLRTAIESAGLALWLVGPNSRQERLRRSLSARIDDINHDDRLVTALTVADVEDSKADAARKQKSRREQTRRARALKAELRAYATAAGIPHDAINAGLPGFGPILRDAGQYADINGNRTEGVWSYISGLTHPSVRRSMAASILEVAVEDDSGTTATISASLSVVALAFDGAIALHLAALRVLARRAGRPELRWTPQWIDAGTSPHTP